MNCNTIFLNVDKNSKNLEHLDILQLNPGGEETLLTKTDINSVTIAPAEGKIPISILFDEYAEEASFCALSLGKIRNFKSKISYKEKISKKK